MVRRHCPRSRAPGRARGGTRRGTPPCPLLDSDAAYPPLSTGGVAASVPLALCWGALSFLLCLLVCWLVAPKDPRFTDADLAKARRVLSAPVERRERRSANLAVWIPPVPVLRLPVLGKSRRLASLATSPPWRTSSQHWWTVQRHQQPRRNVPAPEAHVFAAPEAPVPDEPPYVPFDETKSWADQEGC